MKLTRRTLLRSLLATACAGALTGLYSWQVEPYWVQIKRLVMPIRHLPPALEGRTLVQLSDLHIGNRYDWSYQIAALQGVTAMAPDFVVYTGDFVSYETPEQLTQLRDLLPHAPHGRLGTAAVLGNHDYGHGWAEPAVADGIVALLSEHGIPVLRNIAQTFNDLQLVGLDDYWGTNYNPDFFSTLDLNQPTITLCHNPDVVDQPIWGDYAGWILAGHTHGGQVKPPFLPPPLLPVTNKRYTAGIFELEKERILYINRGLGNLWPIRFNARPEITVFTLASL
ncbi:MAG: metallophosphoesterase [Ardenticatenaceae bacterium]